MEHKFMIGDFLYDGKFTVEVIDITDNSYVVTSEELEADNPYANVQFVIPFEKENNYYLRGHLS